MCQATSWVAIVPVVVIFVVRLVVKRGSMSRSRVRVRVPQPWVGLGWVSEPGFLGVAGDVGFASSFQKEEKCVLSPAWAWVGVGKAVEMRIAAHPPPLSHQHIRDVPGVGWSHEPRTQLRLDPTGLWAHVAWHPWDQRLWR